MNEKLSNHVFAQFQINFFHFRRGRGGGGGGRGRGRRRKRGNDLFRDDPVRPCRRRRRYRIRRRRRRSDGRLSNRGLRRRR